MPNINPHAELRILSLIAKEYRKRRGLLTSLQIAFIFKVNPEKARKLLDLVKKESDQLAAKKI